jgi:hypothetical protein
MRCLFVAFLIAAAAHAESVVYSFIGTDNSGQVPELEEFQLIVPDFIDTPPNGLGVAFTCDQLDSSINCGSPGVIFSDQAVLGAFSAQLQFDAPTVGSIFEFPADAFATPGSYSSEPGAVNTGSLTVDELPEPGSIELTLGAGLLFLFIRGRSAAMAGAANPAARVSKP